MKTPNDARGVAFAVLSRYEETSSFVAPLLDETCTGAGLSAADRRLAGELVHAVVRRQTTLDCLIERHVKRPRFRVERGLWMLLRLGACQLTLMSSIPPHAAVNETVAVAGKIGKRRWTGLCNAVLRAVARSLTDDVARAPAADAVPLSEGKYRRLREPAFPNPAEDFAGYVSSAFSYPRWLVDRWLTRFDEAELIRLAFWFNAPPPPHLRVNLLRIDRDAVLAALEEAGVAAGPGGLPESIRLSERARIDTLPGLEAGWFSVQDESATSAVDLLDPRPGESVLDLCAAPGVKTTHIAERMRNDGRVHATDVNPARLRRVEENCRRLGLSIVATTPIDRDGTAIPDGPFDAVLVDAPCTNTGVLNKRPEVRWRLREQEIAELAALGERLLVSACGRVKPGGRIVYSTCSIEPEENRGVIGQVLRRQPEFRLIEEREHVPGRPADGGYQALIRRE